MDILKKLTEELGIKLWQTEAAVKLIDEGNTIPFISRYRKEATGSLNDEVLRSLHERLAYLRGLEDKKTQVLGSIEEQGALTEAKDQGDGSQGKRTGRPGGSDPASAYEKAPGGGSACLSFGGKRSADGGGGHRRGRRYSGGGYFR